MEKKGILSLQFVCLIPVQNPLGFTDVSSPMWLSMVIIRVKYPFNFRR